jgi:hypothetical protein
VPGSDLDVSGEELAQQVLDLVTAHCRVNNPSKRASQYWHFDFCACGWRGYPHGDHLQLVVAKSLLQQDAAATDE